MCGRSQMVAIGLFIPLTIVLTMVGCGPSPTAAPSDAATPGPRGTIAQSPIASSPPRIGAPSASASPARSTGAQSGFVDQLYSAGFTVERVAEATEPFLRTIGVWLRLSGGALAQPARFAVYTYDDPALAADDAARVQPDTSVKWTEPDGNVKTISFAWVAPPHFFRRGCVLVLYTGTDRAVLTLLTELLGAQFAGR